MTVTTGKAFDRTQYAGSPHVAHSQCYGIMSRFDVGKVASAAKARLGVHCSMLCKSCNTVLVAGVSLFVLFGTARLFADAPDYSTYVQLTESDTGTSATTTSWRSGLNWSDGKPPSSGKNYYVPAGLTLVHPHAADNADNNTWKGGQLAVAGIFHVYASIGDKNGCLVPDLVLLDGAEIRTDCYGPFYLYNNVTSTVTVAATTANPAIISQHYYNTEKVRNNSLRAYFMGTSASALVYTRPLVNYNGLELAKGGAPFECRLYDYSFKNYPGTWTLRGVNTYAKMAEGRAPNWPDTALRVEDGAIFEPYYINGNGNLTYNDNTKNMYLRSLAIDGGQLSLNRNSTQNVLVPLVNVTEGISFGEGAVIAVPTAVKDYIPHRTPEGASNGGKMFRVANLTGVAAANLPDVSNAKICYLTNTMEAVGLGLRFYDGENGSKDLYIAASDIVAMTNANIETTSGDNIQYSAFQSGHAGDWTNLETPSANSALHYWNTAKLCFFQNTELPNATLTIGAAASWKAGAKLTFKEINFHTGYSFGLWYNNSIRTITADRLNIVKRTAADANATLYVFNSLTLNVNADMCGSGNLLMRNNSNQAGTVALGHINTNFHGRLTVQQKSDTTTKYVFTAVLNDARNFGGAYTVNADTYNAITFDNFPNLSVTNDVAFAEPTRNMYISGGAQFTVAEDKTLTLSNQVTYAGELVKAGAGTLELAGTSRFIDGASTTAPVAGTNVLTVAAGALKVSAKEAAEGLAISFAEGTKLVVPADSEYGCCNTTWNTPLTINTTSGKLPVEVALTGGIDGTQPFTAAICTVNSTASGTISANVFNVRKIGCLRCKSVTTRTNADGSVTYLANFSVNGTKVIIR